MHLIKQSVFRSLWPENMPPALAVQGTVPPVISKSAYGVTDFGHSTSETDRQDSGPPSEKLPVGLTPISDRHFSCVTPS